LILWLGRWTCLIPGEEEIQIEEEKQDSAYKCHLGKCNVAFGSGAICLGQVWREGNAMIKEKRRVNEV
jgi:hypothetical protein